MATPLTATHRINIPISVPGLPTHRFRLGYCKAQPTAIGDPSGYDLVMSDLTGIVGFNAAMLDAIPLIRALYDSASSVGPADLEVYDAGAWPILVTDTTSGVGTGSNVGAQITQQTSITFTVAALGEKLRLQFMEPDKNQFSFLGRYTSPAGQPASMVAFILDCVNVGAPHIGSWMRNRGDSGFPKFFSTIYDQNERLKRKRGES